MRISEIYSQAYQVVKKNKALWVFGLAALALTGAGGAGFGNGFNPSSENFKFNESSVSAELLNKQLDSLYAIVTNFLQPIPNSTWIILGLGLLTAVIFAITLSLLLRSWVVGALICGTYDALDEQNKVDLATIGDRGLRSFKSLAALYLLPNSLNLLGLLIFIVLGTILIASNSEVLAIIVWSVGALVFLVTSLLISLASFWAERLIAIENTPWTAAFWQGLKLFQNYFGETFKLGCANVLLGCGLGCAATAIVGPVIALLVLIGIIPIVGWALLPLLIPLGIAIFLIVGVVNAVILTFKYTTWSILFKELHKP